VDSEQWKSKSPIILPLATTSAEQAAEKALPGLMPRGFCWLYAGIEIPASLRVEFSRSLYDPFDLQRLRPPSASSGQA